MPSNSTEFWPLLVMLAECLLLSLLAIFYLKLLQWETAFRESKTHWLLKLRASARQMRTLRLQMEGMPKEISVPGLSPSLKRNIQVGRWVMRMILARKTARP